MSDGFSLLASSVDTNLLCVRFLDCDALDVYSAAFCGYMVMRFGLIWTAVYNISNAFP
jgi:hypothetical protein